MKDVSANVKKVVSERDIYINTSKLYLIVKRIIDFTGAIVGLVFFAPVLIISAIEIKIDSPGPVFFTQERFGLRGRIFKVYKLRSMVKDSYLLQKSLEKKNEVGGHMFKIRNDPRVTRVGRFIRRTSIDELPQLFNILKGEMSFVGPRPPLPCEVNKYDRWHNLRMSVKPGLTGLWQVCGRNNLGFDEMVRLDLKYIREQGLFLDFKIILKTIPLLLGDKRAY